MGGTQVAQPGEAQVGGIPARMLLGVMDLGVHYAHGGDLGRQGGVGQAVAMGTVGIRGYFGAGGAVGAACPRVSPAPGPTGRGPWCS